MKSIIFLLLISMLCLAASCNKDDDMPSPEPDLPPLTTEGLNTFGCYINGEPWVAEVPFGAPLSGIKHLEAFYHPIIVNPPVENYFAIRARKRNQDASLSQSLIIEIGDVQGEGAYEIIYNNNYYSYRDIHYCSAAHFELDTTTLNKVVLTRFDTLAKIASGTFFLTAINRECNDTLIITDGRFDTKFKP